MKSLYFLKFSNSIIDTVLRHASSAVKKVREKYGDYEFDDDFDLTDHDIVTLKKGHYYQGEYDDGAKKPIGSGIEVRPDGSVYEGYQGGPGRLIQPSGDMYEGEFKKDKADGKGTFISVDGQKYVGQWVADRKHGKGVETFANGSK